GTTVTGFTVTGGNGTDGGGVEVHGPGDLALLDCSITDNVARRGGGIFASGDVTLDLTGTTVDGNLAADGGGLYLAGGSAAGGTLTDNTATSEYSYSDGGGGALLTGDVALVGTAITGNHTFRADGGGLTVLGSATLTDVTITDNDSAFNGGGLMVLGAEATLLGTCVVSGNTADSSGGGARLQPGSALTGGEFTANDARDGGGVSIWSADLVGVNIHHNTARFGGGVDVRYESEIRDTVIRENTASDDGGGLNVFWGLGGYEDGLTITGATIVGNSADKGGGLNMEATEPWPISLVDTTLADNTANRGAGAHLSVAAQLVVVRGAITGNVAAVVGGGVWTEVDVAAIDAQHTDWGDLATDNAPDDVYTDQVPYLGYGADASFTCAAGSCTPPPE
ncbi:MAG: right-handed parallel beta-helix repeat-containing protein, partial [Myxococcota bacterium]